MENKRPTDFGEALVKAATRIVQAATNAKAQGVPSEHTEGVIEGLRHAEHIIHEEYNEACDKAGNNRG